MKNDFGRNILKGDTLPFDHETSQRATDKFFAYEPPKKLGFSPDGRRMNHFMLGADPEFMFVQDRAPVHATHLGLKAGLAFGADQNDRLVELRAAPSRDAVKVLASVLAELRWLYRFLGDRHSAYSWNACAFAHGDGMGGHVHFGRKRPHQADEVRGLDGLARVMRAVDLFDSEGWNRRAAGDQFNQLYGQYGDIRPQKHGYEYRTLPTWLDNPRLAFLVLTLSKLVIIDPDITASWNHPRHSPGHTWTLLQGLAKYYKGRDDDALILYSMMDAPEKFRFVGGDFRLRWGLSGETKPLPLDHITPPVIEATDEDLTDLSIYLTDGKPLPMRECAANFRASLPKGYHWTPNLLEYRRRPNIGDVFYDTVQHPDMNVSWDFDSRGCAIHAPHGYDVSALRKVAEGISVGNAGTNFMIRIGLEWRKGAQLALLRKVMYSGLLPIWKVDDVAEDSLKKWAESVNKVSKFKKKSKYAGLLKGL